MARQISPEVADNVKDLITQVTGLEDGTPNFKVIEKYFHEKLRKSDTMYFLNKTEVDRSIAGMSEKFCFHGFFSQAKALEEAYNGFISPNVSKSQLITHLNVVKFLLCMSEKPTSKFLDTPEEFEIKSEPKEEEIDWGEYLKEGIESTLPRFDDSTDFSDISSIDGGRDSPDNEEEATAINNPVVISCSEKDVVMNFRANREELLNTIQHSWYNDQNFHNAPPSERNEANIAIMWENYLEKQAMGLVLMKKSNVISEYKVIREILWQLWDPHTSAVFKFEGNSLTTRTDVTISSSRSNSFHSFLQNQILPYIVLLESFKDFSESLVMNSEECIINVPQTYRSYNRAIQNVIRPIYLKLSELEDKVREQETTYTLLNLSEDLQMILEPLVLLKKVHSSVTIDFSNENNFRCASSLLTHLHDSLQYSVNKLDQDLRVTLYIESLYHYLTVIDSWFMKNDLNDYSEEFIIINKNQNVFRLGRTHRVTSASESDTDYCNLNFIVTEGIDEASKNDGVLKIIMESVIQIGRNLHLLRLLGDFSVINENKETIYEEFVRKTLEELCKFFEHDPKDIFPENCNKNFEPQEEITYKFPVMCTEDCQKPTEMDKLENLVDTSDGFLMLAFKDFFKLETKKAKPAPLSLYEKISSITTTFFPVTNFFEKILDSLLKERFTISGLRVKNILCEQYLLEKQFQFLRHIFLFFDNIIFPFYRRFFMKVYAESKNWGNDIWLTSHLQDIIMDIYPEFYEKCSVQVGENWNACCDPLDACDMVTVNIDIQWPLNVIISQPHMVIYKDIFNFILKIKWGLYTLNHLSFKELEPKCERKKKPSKSHKNITMKLKYLRFALINLLNSIHHYIFSFDFTKCLQQFELDFEKASDLSSIMASHSDFINNSYKLILEIKNCGREKAAFENVNKGIKELKYLWENIGCATPQRLYENYENYKHCFNAINPVISPVYLFDY